MRTLPFAILITLCCCFNASAALTFSLTPSASEIQPNGGTVRFTGSVSGDAGEVLTGFDLFFDVQQLDLPAPAVLTITDQTFLTGFEISEATVASSGRDFGFTNAALFAPALQTAGGVDLFSFNANFGPAAPGTRFDLNFDPAAPGSQVALTSGTIPDITGFTFNDASVTVAAIPEPSSTLALGAVFLAGVYRWRRGKNLHKAV